MSLNASFQMRTVCIVATGSSDMKNNIVKIIKPKNLSISLYQKSENPRAAAKPLARGTQMVATRDAHRFLEVPVRHPLVFDREPAFAESNDTLVTHEAARLDEYRHDAPSAEPSHEPRAEQAVAAGFDVQSEKVQPIPDEEESQTYQSAIHANFPQFVGEL